MAKKLNISALAEKLSQLNSNSGGSGSSMGFLTVKDGRNVIRVLPPRDDMDSFAVEAWVHFGIGKNDQNKSGQMVTCPTTHDENARCPICELSKEFYGLSKKKDDSYSKQAKAYFRKKRVYYNALDRGEDLSVYERREEEVDGETKYVWYNTEKDEKESPVKVLATGIGVYKDIISLIIDPEYGDITDAEEGLDLIINKTGSGQFNTKYKVSTVRKESEIGLEHWESSLNDLTPLLKVKSYDDIAKILDGNTEGGETTEEDTNDDIKDAGDMLPDKNATDDSDGDDGLQDEIKAAMARRQAKK